MFPVCQTRRAGNSGVFSSVPADTGTDSDGTTWLYKKTSPTGQYVAIHQVRLSAHLALTIVLHCKLFFILMHTHTHAQQAPQHTNDCAPLDLTCLIPAHGLGRRKSLLREELPSRGLGLDPHGTCIGDSFQLGAVKLLMYVAPYVESEPTHQLLTPFGLDPQAAQNAEAWGVCHDLLGDAWDSDVAARRNANNALGTTQVRCLQHVIISSSNDMWWKYFNITTWVGCALARRRRPAGLWLLDRFERQEGARQERILRRYLHRTF